MRLPLFIALTAILQQQAVPLVPAQASKIKDGVITVNVVDSITRNPVSGARVTFIFFQTPPPNVVTYVNSDANGKAVFKDLSEGRYGIGAEREGFVSNPAAAVTGLAVEIKTENQKADFTVALVRGAIVTGRVLDANGFPVAKATVTMAKPTYRDGRRTLPRVGGGAASLTDDRGEYRISGLGPGAYYLRTELELGNCRTCVTWDDLPRTSFYPGVTDSRAGVPLTVAAAQEMSLDVKLPMVNTYTISGIVINPLDGGRVFAGEQSREVSSYYIGPADPESLEEPILIAARYTKTGNPNESHFEIPSIVPGTYYLYPLFNVGSGINGYVTNQTLVKVDDHDVGDLRITLKPNSSMSGKIAIDDEVPASFPWNTIRISLRSRDRLPTLLGGVVAPSATVSDPQTGAFTIPGVTDAHFAVLVSGLPPDAYVSDVLHGGRSVFTDDVVSSVGSEPLEIHVKNRGGSLQGLVQKADGTLAVRTPLTLVPSQTLRKNSQLYKRVTTDANGAFTIRGIAPGEYKLFAWSSVPPGQADENAQFIEQFESRGTTALVTGAMITPITLKVLQLP